MFQSKQHISSTPAPQTHEVSTAASIERYDDANFPKGVLIALICLSLAVTVFVGFFMARAVDQILFSEDKYDYQMEVSETVTDEPSPSVLASDRKLLGNISVASDATLYRVENGATVVPLGANVQLNLNVQEDAVGTKIFVVKHSSGYTLPDGAEWELPLILEAGNECTTEPLSDSSFSTMDEGYYSFHAICDNYADEIWSECVLFLDMNRLDPEIVPASVSAASVVPTVATTVAPASSAPVIEYAVQTTMPTVSAPAPIEVSENYAEIEIGGTEIFGNNDVAETADVPSEPIYLGRTEEGTDMWEIPSDSHEEPTFFFAAHMFGSTIVTSDANAEG